MNRTATVTFAFAGIITILLSGAAFGQLGTGTTQEDKKIDIELEPTRLGDQFGFLGLAVKKVDNGVEIFGARAFADMPDQTLLEVVIVTARGEFVVGSIEMFLGSGGLELVSSTNPSPAFPMSRIREVLVTYRGQVVLSGEFPS